MAIKTQVNTMGQNRSHEGYIDVLRVGSSGGKKTEQVATMTVNGTNETIEVIGNSNHGNGIMSIERHIQQHNRKT